MKDTIVITKCDITGNPIRGEALHDVEIGSLRFADADAAAVAKIEAFAKRMGEPKKKRVSKKSGATIPNFS